ncbi:MAG: glycosyltransferase [Thiomicrorhabdus sp.]|jgi:glycosyltransferase involved in cell wall biosynthesis|nr:glycosyltransferase [Thiomicrorhabdus sp.]
MSTIRIAQVTLSMGQGGIENLLIALAENQDAERYATYLYCLDHGGELLTQIAALGVPTKVLGRRPGLDFKLILRLARAFKEDAIQLVHTHNEAAHFYGCLAARLARIPVINTEHSRHYVEGHWRRQLEKRFLSFLTAKLVTVSEELRRASIDQDRLSAKKITVVSNGVDLARFSSIPLTEGLELKKALSFEPNNKIITIVARLNPIKNHDLLIKAFALVQQPLPEARLLIVGDGDLRANLQDVATKLTPPGMVVFLGDRSDVPVLLKMSDVLVLCSHREGLPLVLLEGMAAGVPIVVTEGANQSSLIQDWVTGCISQSDAQGLADTLLKVLSDNVTEKIASNAKKLVTEQYSIDQTVAQYETLYQQMLKQGS